MLEFLLPSQSIFSSASGRALLRRRERLLELRHPLLERRDLERLLGSAGSGHLGETGPLSHGGARGYLFDRQALSTAV